MRITHHFVITAFVLLASTASWAQSITTQDAWVRATVPGQKATGAFMKLTSKEGAKLVGVSTAVAGVAEIHEMKMDKDVMKMSAVPALDLPAGQTVELKPGSYHLMLMDLKQALPKDSTVALTLQLVDAKGQKTQVELKVPVSMQAPAGMGAAMPHGGHKH